MPKAMSRKSRSSCKPGQERTSRLVNGAQTVRWNQRQQKVAQRRGGRYWLNRSEFYKESGGRSLRGEIAKAPTCSGEHAANIITEVRKHEYDKLPTATHQDPPKKIRTEKILYWGRGMNFAKCLGVGTGSLSAWETPGVD